MTNNILFGLTGKHYTSFCDIDRYAKQIKLGSNMENKKEAITGGVAQTTEVYRAKNDDGKLTKIDYGKYHPFSYGGVDTQKMVQEENQKHYADLNETVLQEAERLTNSKRKKEYGTYTQNAEKAVEIYRAIKGTSMVETAADVALFQLSHKLGREACKHKRDNIVDACGYLKLYYEEVVNDTNKKNTGLFK